MKTTDQTTISLAKGAVDKVGQDMIRGMLSSHAPDALHLPADWDWAARIGGKGEYVGTLPKRIAKYYWQKSKVKLPSDLLGKIGSTMGLHTAKEESYTFDIVDCFDWEAGDYGDDGSCYWGCHASARVAIEKHRCLAIRFFGENGGIGRAWLAETPDGWVLFNAYGLDAPLAARILATYRGLSYRKVPITNNGVTSGAIYLNCDGHLIGSEESINDHGPVELGITAGKSCYDCNEFLDEDNYYITLPNGDHLCETCSDDFSPCEDCNEYYHYDNMFNVQDRMVCENCIDRYTYCDDCSEHHDKGDCERINGKYVCQNCRNKGGYLTCDVCNDWYKLDDTMTIDDQTYCHDCADDVDYSVCEECGDYYTDCVDRRCAKCGKMVWPASIAPSVRKGLMGKPTLYYLQQRRQRTPKEESNETL